MRFLHLSDLHIGKTVNGFSMLNDQRFVLEQVLNLARQKQVDAIVVAGDVYDKSVPSAEAVALLDWFLAQIAQAGITCLAVPGNHDSAERVAYASGILGRQGIHFPPVYDGSVAKVVLHDQHGPVNFWLLPFLKPIHVRGHFPDVEIGNDYTAAIKAALSSCEINASERNVLVAHQFVTADGAVTERTESELSLGDVENVSFRCFDAFDYVALGHVHRPQQVGRAQVRYAGSPLKYSFSEIPYPKTVPLVDLGPKAYAGVVNEGDGGNCCVSFDLLELPCLHDMRQVKGTFAQLTSPDVVEAAPSDDYLHVVLTDQTPVIDAVSRIRSYYPNVMALDYAPVQSGSAGDQPEVVDVRSIDPFQAFGAFFESQLGHSLNEEQSRIARRALERALENGLQGCEASGDAAAAVQEGGR